MVRPTQSDVPEWRIVNERRLAQIIGVSIARITHLVSAGLPRRPNTKLYDLAEAIPLGKGVSVNTFPVTGEKY